MKYAMVLVVVTLLAAPLSVLADDRRFSDDQLIQLVQDTSERGDYVYVAVHTSALLERNPPAVANNPTFRNQLDALLMWAIDRLEDDRKTANRARSASSDGVGVLQAGLSSLPPRVDFPTKNPKAERIKKP